MIVIVLLIVAVICFILAAAGASKPDWTWVAIGLACFAGAFLVSNLGGT